MANIINTNGGKDFSSVTPAILVDISGNYTTAGGGGGVLSLNGASGTVNILGAGNVAVSSLGNTITVSGLSGGDVFGPVSSTDNAIAKFDSTSGKLLQDSSILIDTSTVYPISTNTGSLGLITNTFSGLYIGKSSRTADSFYLVESLGANTSSIGIVPTSIALTNTNAGVGPNLTMTSSNIALTMASSSLTMASSSLKINSPNITVSGSQASIQSLVGADYGLVDVSPTATTIQQTSSGQDTYISVLANQMITKGNFRPILSGTDTIGTANFPYSGISANNINNDTLNSNNGVFSTLVRTSVVSGTTISGNSAVFQNLTVTNPVSYTIVNASVVSGTTISGNTATIATINNTNLNGSTGLFTTTVNSPTLSGTTINNDTFNGKTGVFSVLGRASVISGTTISGNTLSLAGQFTGSTAVFSSVVNASVISGTTFSGNTYIGDSTMLNFVIDGGGSVIASGNAGFVEIPYNATPLSWDLFANVSGSLSVDVRRTTAYANWSGVAGITSADSIVGSEKPTITTAFKGQDTSITTWSGISAGNILSFHVDATPSNITRATLSIKMTKTS